MVSSGRRGCQKCGNKKYSDSRFCPCSRPSRPGRFPQGLAAVADANQQPSRAASNCPPPPPLLPPPPPVNRESGDGMWRRESNHPRSRNSSDVWGRGGGGRADGSLTTSSPLPPAPDPPPAVDDRWRHGSDHPRGSGDGLWSIVGGSSDDSLSIPRTGQQRAWHRGGGETWADQEGADVTLRNVRLGLRVVRGRHWRMGRKPWRDDRHGPGTVIGFTDECESLRGRNASTANPYDRLKINEQHKAEIGGGWCVVRWDAPGAPEAIYPIGACGPLGKWWTDAHGPDEPCFSLQLATSEFTP